MTVPKIEPPPPDDISTNLEGFPDVQDLLPMLLGQTDAAPNGCDVEAYLAMMDKKFEKLPETEKRKLIHYLWNLCEAVIGVQFGVDPVQLARRSDTKTAPQPSDFMVKSESQIQTAFARVAAHAAAKRKKG